MGHFWGSNHAPQASERRVDFKGLADLVDAFRSVGAPSTIVEAAELVVVQPAILSKFGSILSAATDKIWAKFGFNWGTHFRL